MRWFRWGDAIPAVAVLLIAVLMLVPWASSAAGAVVKVQTPDGTEYLSLAENREVSVEGRGYRLTLVVQDGQVYVREATCPDQVCRHTGAISRTAQSIACVPAAVIVTVEGAAEDAQPDAVTR